MPEKDLCVKEEVKPSGFNHSFDVGVSVKCGIEAACLYNHLCYWLNHNKIRGMNQHEGRTWTYDSVEKMSEYLPYLSVGQIKRAIAKLVDAKLIIKGNFNKDKFDRTNWYALNDEMKSTFSKKVCESTECVPSIGQIWPMQKPDPTNPLYTDTIHTNTKNTSSKVSESNEPIQAANAGSADASEGEDLNNSNISKKTKTPSSFSPEVRNLKDKVILCLKRHSLDYRPPDNPLPLLKHLALLLEKDQHDPDRILKVLEWALEDNEERGDFKGWSSVIYAKNPIETLRKHFVKIARQMESKPKKKERKFAPSSDDQKAYEIMKKMSEDAL